MPNLIRFYREKAGLSQEVLADQSGLSRGTIINYEKGKRSPRITELDRIGRVLGCTAADLIGNPTEAPARRRRAIGASQPSAG
jgi:transcriptional regulator with XRE-family HTH domain